MRKNEEENIYEQIKKLTAQPGYVFTLAKLKLSANYKYNLSDATDKLNLQNYSSEKLCNNEMLLLEGFLRQNIINFDYIPSEKDVEQQIQETKKLLKELQDILGAIIFADMKRKSEEKSKSPQFHELDGIFKEFFFYSSESGWPFQFIDLAKLKYQSDNEWLKQNKGFFIEEVCQLARFINKFPSFNTKSISNENQKCSIKENLNDFVISVSDLAKYAKLSEECVRAILKAFSRSTLEKTNLNFSSMTDHNEVLAYPWLDLDNDKFLLLNENIFSSSIYQAPYFWFLREDKSYYDRVYTGHRGQAIEDISVSLLARVFGKENIHQNIFLYQGKDIIGEIDVLVEWGGVVILVQNKAQMLTQASRKGDLDKVKDNFQKAIGDAYNQNVVCAKLLLQAPKNLTIKTQDNTVYSLKHEIKEIFPACIVGEDYTGLTFQARSLLEIQKIPKFKKPLLASVIYLDTLTRILNSPVHFIHYLNRLDDTWGKIISADDYAILGYHIEGNLYPPSESDLIIIGNDCSSYVDRSLIIQDKFAPIYETAQSSEVPDNLKCVKEWFLDRLSFVKELPPFLKYWQTPPLGRVLACLNQRNDPKALQVALFLLNLPEEDLNEISSLISNQAQSPLPIKKIFLMAPIGLMIMHIRECKDRDSISDLKISMSGAEKEFTPPKCLGLSVSSDGDVFDYDFTENPKNRMKMPLQTKPVRDTKKVGRNEKCPCGSDKKFKKCCGAPNSK